MRAEMAELSGADDLTTLDQLPRPPSWRPRSGTTWSLVYTLAGLAVLAARRSLIEVAAVLFASAEATAEASSLPLSFPPSRKGVDHWLRVVREQLDADDLAAAQESGRTLPPERGAGPGRQIKASGPG